MHGYRDLHHNVITHLHRGTFVNLPSLTALYLNDNRITSLPGFAFSNLDALESLCVKAVACAYAASPCRRACANVVADVCNCAVWVHVACMLALFHAEVQRAHIKG